MGSAALFNHHGSQTPQSWIFEAEKGIAPREKEITTKGVSDHDISSAELSHGEVDFDTYKLDLLWKSILFEGLQSYSRYRLSMPFTTH